MKNDIYDKIIEHFETKDEELELSFTFDSTVARDMFELDRVSAEAWRAVKDLSLNYRVDAKHHEVRVNDTEDGSVEVTWVFWK